MKKSKILVPALGILVLSTAASITGTVAWFTASSFVEVSGFKMQAEAEQGIVIANEDKDGADKWAITAQASHDGTIDDGDNSTDDQQSFVPTSTANASTWYHANAANADSHVHTGNYVTNTPSEVMDGSDHTGVFQMNIAPSGSAANNKNIYLLNKFYVQSSSNSAINGQDVYISKLAFSGNASSEALNRTLRMAVKYGTSDVVIFGFGAYDDTSTTDAIEGYTRTYTVNGASSVTAQTTYVSDSDNTAQINIAENVNIPAYKADGTTAIEVSVYLYFEGEDVNCKSSNITTSLDTLQISFQLGNKVHPTNP